MTDSKARIDRLNEIIDSLDEEADHLQNAIEAATTQLEEAIQLSKEASKAAAVVSASALGKIDTMTEKSEAFLDEQGARAAEFHETLGDFIAAESERNVALLEAQEEFHRTTLKNGEIFRDKVQTDLLQSKNDLASRVQSLSEDFSHEAGVLAKRIAALEDSLSAPIADNGRRLKLIFIGTVTIAVLEAIILIATMVR
ncbi:hypothetical protein VJ918_02470 [Adlercreutzia sp. R21]|uniref:hypothetical protein n=1 Tax=Adlercreutzia wanghongyangiae TaxID=3111451 RepID=UPI002DB92810|nr:hypothetical protein [Adlercreutzia sp. R21]MEC4183665.1 hypothetical protein [Adlercreutzia sp. R21]